MSLDERLRAALLDLDERVSQHMPDPVAPPRPRPTQPRMRPSWGRWRPALAMATVGVLILLVAWAVGTRSGGSTPPAGPAPSPSTSASATASADERASQAPADAARDGVDQRIAAQPLGRRNVAADPAHDGARTSATTSEGTWMVTLPHGIEYSEAIAQAVGCLPPNGGADNIRFLCDEYGEVLLTSPTRDRILRAYPIPGANPQWVVVTPDAIYCGRQGVGGNSVSMVCRIDRTTGEFTGRIFPLPSMPTDPSPLTGRVDRWPGTWTVNAPVPQASFDSAALSDGALLVSDWQHTLTVRLDPVTLEPRS